MYNLSHLSQVWYDMAMDGQLWYDLYRKQWPIGIGLEAQLDHTKKTLVVRDMLLMCLYSYSLAALEEPALSVYMYTV